MHVVDVYMVDCQNSIADVQSSAAFGRRSCNDPTDGGSCSGHGWDDDESESFVFASRYCDVIGVSLGVGSSVAFWKWEQNFLVKLNEDKGHINQEKYCLTIRLRHTVLFCKSNITKTLLPTSIKHFGKNDIKLSFFYHTRFQKWHSLSMGPGQNTLDIFIFPLCSNLRITHTYQQTNSDDSSWLKQS